MDQRRNAHSQRHGAALTEADIAARRFARTPGPWDERRNHRRSMILRAEISNDDVIPRRCRAIARSIGKMDGKFYAVPRSPRLPSLPRASPCGCLSVDYCLCLRKREAARLLAANRPLSMYMHNGVGQHTNATQTSRAIATLYALIGDIDRQGGNVVFPKAPAKPFPAKNYCRKKWPISESAENESHSVRRPSPATAPPTIFLPRFSKAAPIRSRHCSILARTRS